MKVVDPGHIYQVDSYDGKLDQHIQFMKRIGAGFPGNEGTIHPGTNCQELIRVLIDRVNYLDNQIQNVRNQKVIECFRLALFHLEARAAERHNLNPSEITELQILEPIEEIVHCKKCGHILCEQHENWSESG